MRQRRSLRLDHCLVRANVSCVSRRDCPEGEFCLLSGYAGPSGRMNEGMVSYCSGTDGANPYATNLDAESHLDEGERAFAPAEENGLPPDSLVVRHLRETVAQHARMAPHLH